MYIGIGYETLKPRTKVHTFGIPVITRGSNGISQEAFETEQAPGVQAQLVDIFVNGLQNDHLKLTILRRNPDTLRNAVCIATTETK
ncbi:hypothetical protein MAR_002727, partial [Mya arenaria]